MADAESRAYPRFAIEAAVELRSQTKRAKGRTDNVSRGGVCAVVDVALETGSIVEVNLALVFDNDTFSEPLALPARVVWSTALGPGKHQLGTSFLKLNDQQKNYLDMFLRFLEEGLAVREAAEDDGMDDEPEDPFAS